MSAPVVVFAYTRLEHLKNTLESLEKNSYAKDSDLYIYSDAAKTPSVEAQVEAVRNYIDEFQRKSSFKSISVFKQERNKGLASSIIDAVTEIINKFGCVIVVEDDLCVSSDFLEYMNEALEYYKDNNKIWSIAGYTAQLPCLKDYEYDVYLSYRGSSWGWATWKDRWNRVDWEVNDFNKLKNSKRAIRKLNRGGEDMFRMLNLQMEGKINSWAIRWCYQQSKENMYTVHPRCSKVLNDGLDGSGEHCSVTDKYSTDLVVDKLELCVPPVSKKILKEFRELYSSNLTMLDKVKIYIKKNILKMDL